MSSDPAYYDTTTNNTYAQEIEFDEDEEDANIETDNVETWNETCRRLAVTELTAIIAEIPDDHNRLLRCVFNACDEVFFNESCAAIIVTSADLARTSLRLFDDDKQQQQRNDEELTQVLRFAMRVRRQDHSQPISCVAKQFAENRMVHYIVQCRLARYTLHTTHALYETLRKRYHFTRSAANEKYRRDQFTSTSARLASMVAWLEKSLEAGEWNGVKTPAFLMVDFEEAIQQCRTLCETWTHTLRDWTGVAMSAIDKQRVQDWLTAQ